MIDPRRAELHALATKFVDELLAVMATRAHAPLVVSTVNLPPDAKNAQAFNRACRRGDVAGAEKRGRVWTCTLAAWNARRAAPAPKVARRDAKPENVSSALLERLGARRKVG